MALDKMLHELIPPPLNEHCRALNVAGTTLILAADSPVWAARLRFHTPQLVKQLSSEHPFDIRAVRIRVRPADRPAPPEKRQNRPRRTPLGAAALKQAAQFYIGFYAEICTSSTGESPHHPLNAGKQLIHIE